MTTKCNVGSQIEFWTRKRHFLQNRACIEQVLDTSTAPSLTWDPASPLICVTKIILASLFLSLSPTVYYQPSTQTEVWSWCSFTVVPDFTQNERQSLQNDQQKLSMVRLPRPLEGALSALSLTHCAAALPSSFFFTDTQAHSALRPLQGCSFGLEHSSPIYPHSACPYLLAFYQMAYFQQGIH